MYTYIERDKWVWNGLKLCTQKRWRTSNGKIESQRESHIYIEREREDLYCIIEEEVVSFSANEGRLLIGCAYRGLFLLVLHVESAKNKKKLISFFINLTCQNTYTCNLKSKKKITFLNFSINFEWTNKIVIYVGYYFIKFLFFFILVYIIL